jgi:hypothetical protein
LLSCAKKPSLGTSSAQAARSSHFTRWQQGDAIWQWIEPLTDPGDFVVDPFTGSGEWGHIIAAMGRRWNGKISFFKI